ncbi:MAG: GTP-binding protein [Candidatus Rokuibacteriota bacterium]|nr:MAG: GTP-binding protein [Candidatus Rokubacteria bacterium]
MQGIVSANGLLIVAILSGYALLSPSELARATTVARPLPVPTPGPVSDYVGRPVERAPEAPRVTWPKTITGQILDANRSPLEGASVVIGGVEHLTNAEGRFTIEGHPPDASMLVKRPGFARMKLSPTRDAIELVMQPQLVKAAYLTYFGIGDKGIRGRVLDLAARTELNAVVIDVKGDRGWIVYRTEVPEALAVGAQGPATLKDFDGLMADLKSRGIYTIARIVTFKDNVLANGRPDLAIIDTRTGRPWIDNEKLAWVDPFREEVWRYNVAIAREAASKGFDEIQFDYVRFPTDGKLGAAKYSSPNNKTTRLPAIAGFLGKARRELGPLGVFVAADVFGYTAFNDNDTDIGQRIEELAPHLDYLCPMVYPSGYHVGIPGFRNPVQNPYEVVRESVRLIQHRASQHRVRVRPWLQDFKDYAFDRRIFGVTEVRAQIKGADDAGAVGWMLWNPRNDYTASALRQKEASGTK